MGSTFYLILKYIHIAAAITAVGANITYGVWNARSQSDTAHLGFALNGIKFIDDRIANPSYGVVLLTGLIMIFVGSWGFRLWIILALILFAATVAVAIALYSPLLNRLIKLVDTGGTSSPEFEAAIRRNRIIGIVFAILLALILFMMVFKPTI
jgi:uncharacterized membrane protein